jgi:hypothetical protein
MEQELGLQSFSCFARFGHRQEGANSHEASQLSILDLNLKVRLNRSVTLNGSGQLEQEAANNHGAS